MKFPWLLKLWPLKPQGGVGEGLHFFIDFLDSSWHLPDLCELLTPRNPQLRPPWGGVGQMFLGTNDFRTNLCMRAKFGCCQTVVSKKRGEGTDRHTHMHTHKGTRQLYIVDANVIQIRDWSASAMNNIVSVVFMQDGIASFITTILTLTKHETGTGHNGDK